MLGALDSEVRHHAFDDSGVGAQAARRQQFEDDLVADPGVRGVEAVRGETGWDAVLRRATRRVRVKLSRSGSVSASSATVCISQRMA
jgi:hypothetical protein